MMCTVVLHDDTVSHEESRCDLAILPAENLAYLSAVGANTICIAPKQASLSLHEVSLHVSIAKQFGFENRMAVRITPIENAEAEDVPRVPHGGTVDALQRMNL